VYLLFGSAGAAPNAALSQALMLVLKSHVSVKRSTVKEAQK
jgi:hypothetical protein